MESFITNEEREKCAKVAEAFQQIYTEGDVLLFDAGNYGFVKIHDYIPCSGFEGITTFTNSSDMVNNLWNEWLLQKVFNHIQGSALENTCYEDALKKLPENIKSDVLSTKELFSQLTNLPIV